VIIEKAFGRSVELLRKNANKGGFKASSDYYEQIWARDGAIACLAAYYLGDRELRERGLSTLRTLQRHRSKWGQIPTYVDEKRRRIHWHSIDSTLWWILLADLYGLGEESLKASYNWLEGRIVDNTLLLDSGRGMDWMDAAIGREGKVLYINVLWYKVAGLFGEIDPEEIRENVNLLFWPDERTASALESWGFTGFYFPRDFTIPNRLHYLNYVSFGYVDDRMDTWANLLAYLFDVADREKADRMREFINGQRLAEPGPIKSLYPPLLTPGLAWNPIIDAVHPPQHRSLPYQYHNGGIWPFIGGFYVLFLAKLNRREEAEIVLEDLAKVNLESDFNEWLHGLTGQPMGARRQTWNAASYVLAYLALEHGVKPWELKD